MTLSFLNSEDLNTVHRNTLRILEEVGVCLTEPKAVSILCENGAREKGSNVLIPPLLVEKCISDARKELTLHNRKGDSITIGGGDTYFHNLGGAPYIFEPQTGCRRFAKVQDVCDATKILDALQNCHTITPFFTPTDIPGAIMSLAMYCYTISNTTKVVQGPGVQNPAEVRYIIRMAEVIGSPVDMLTLAVSPVSPLSFPDQSAAAIDEIARNNIAFTPLPCPTAGTTAPLSIIGAVTQQNAEVMASIVLAELVKPGLPIIYCGRLAMMEPHTGVSVWGGVELALASAATVQVGHYYGFPVNVYGFSTNAHILDCQNGFERALNACIPVLTGADEVSGIGEMDAGMMGSYSQMLIDNELIGSIKRIRIGIEPDMEVVNVIQKVMDTSRNFVMEKHTIKKLREGEIYLTNLAERSSWDSWQDNDQRGIEHRAQSEAERILKEHIIPPLDSVQIQELDRILDCASGELINGN